MWNSFTLSRYCYNSEFWWISPSRKKANLTQIKYKLCLRSRFGWTQHWPEKKCCQYTNTNMKLKQIERSRKGDSDQGSVGPSVQMPASGEQTLSWWFQLWWYRSDQYRSVVGRSIQINSDQSNTEAALDTRRSIQRLWTNAKLIELGPNMVLHLFNHHVYCLHPPLPALAAMKL